MATDKKSLVSKGQIEEWKKKFGNVYRIETEDGRYVIIFDPLYDIKIAKLVSSALINKTPYEYVKAVLNNCYLAGDAFIKDDESICAGIEDQIMDFTDIPVATVTREGDKYVIAIEEYKVEVRKAKRADIQWSEQRNAAKEIFETAINLLKRIAITPYEEYSKLPSRVLIGIYSAIDKVKDKTAARVEKL